MLPTKTIQLDQVSFSARDILGDGESKVVAWSFAYRTEELKQAAFACEMNIDRFLTSSVLQRLLEKSPIEELLFFYTPRDEYILLSVTSRQGKSQCTWLKTVPGFYEFGSDYLDYPSEPFLFWDRHSLHRIYTRPDFSDSNKPLVSDFSCPEGLGVFETDDDTADNIRKNPLDYWYYSVVPDSQGDAGVSEFAFLSHTFYALM